MARHEDIVNTIWDDLDHLGNDAFFLYVWSFTNTKCGMAGIYPVTRRKLVEGRFADEQLTAALAELEGDEKLFYLDGVLWNKGRVSRLYGFDKEKLSRTIAESIAKDLRAIAPTNPLLARWFERYGDHPNLSEYVAPLRPPAGGRGGGTQPQSQSQVGRGSTGGPQTPHSHSQSQGQGQSQSPDDQSPSKFPEVFAALERVAFARNLTAPKVPATLEACEEFSHLDLDGEAAKFAHYWTEGPGEKKPLADVAWGWRNWLGKVRDDGPKIRKVTTAEREAYDSGANVFEVQV